MNRVINSINRKSEQIVIDLLASIEIIQLLVDFFFLFLFLNMYLPNNDNSTNSCDWMNLLIVAVVVNNLHWILLLMSVCVCMYIYNDYIFIFLFSYYYLDMILCLCSIFPHLYIYDSLHTFFSSSLKVCMCIYNNPNICLILKIICKGNASWLQ